MKKTFIISLIALSLLATTVFGASSQYYSKTSVYFNVPSDATFSLGLPSSYSLTSITGTTEGTATASSPSYITFNFTNVPQNYVQPYAAGASASTQNGAAVPIFYVLNTGNTNEKISVRFDNTLVSGITVGVNASCGGTCGTTTAIQTSLASTYVTLATAVTANSHLNVTLWGNVSSGTTAGETTVRTLYINSTAV